MRAFCTLATAILLVATVPSPARAVGPPASSPALPSASQYGASLLPETKGVVSWKTLARVESTVRGRTTTLKFSDEILGLDGKAVRVQGFMLPLDTARGQHHFLLSAVPPSCPFCLPAGPDAIVEVVAKKTVGYRFEPIVLAGKFAVLRNDSAGVFYRLTDAEPVASTRK